MDERNTLLHHPPPRASSCLTLLTCCSCIGGFLFGYDTGVISGALVSMKSSGFNMTTFETETIVSATIIGAILGASIGGYGNESVGRRPMILFSSALFTFGAVAMGYAKTLGLLIAGRFIVGLAIGISSMTVPVYIAESSPFHSRGTLVSLNTLMVTGGQFFASLFDGVLSTTPDGWRYMLGLVAVPSVLQFLGFLLLPESPRWLIGKGHRSAAQQALIRIRGNQDILEEWELMVAESDELDQRSQHIFKDLMQPPVLRALILGCGLQILQQLCGINTVMYYGATIIQMAGFTDPSTAIWLAAIVAFSNFAFTFVGIFLVDRAGRRTTTLWSLAGVVLTLTALGTTFYMAKKTSIEAYGVGDCSGFTTCFDCVASPGCGFCAATSKCIPGNEVTPLNSMMCENKALNWSFRSCPRASETWSYLIVASMFTYLACFASGMGCMPWTINAEIYPTRVRSVAIGAATTSNWVSNLVVSYTFLSITEVLSPFGAFWLYAGIALLGFIWLYNALPETKGVPLEDIARLFERPTDNYERLS
ncbi:proton myo-inositol cotransporter [Thraustotheca clavata]|uniref:Hexose transporter 1 n=1 Tax=Thraustotheca clavata TaxID=74557 RepID=A0A1W0A689_9STRA|nr:proton myo-inositol cotransporter [Thraustotheca clavata]